jgi:hypothetical protein
MGVIMLTLSSMRGFSDVKSGTLEHAVNKMVEAVIAQKIVRFMSVSLMGLPFDSTQNLAPLTN